jgi:plastocyanin
MVEGNQSTNPNFGVIGLVIVFFVILGLAAVLVSQVMNESTNVSPTPTLFPTPTTQITPVLTPTSKPLVSPVISVTATPIVTATLTPSPTIQATISTTELSITARNNFFEPKVLNVVAGRTYQIRLKVSEGSHSFVVEDWNVHSALFNGGQETLIPLTVPSDAAGKTVQFKCSVHGSTGMTGQLVVSAQ